MNFDNIDEIFDFAIKNEEEASAFYTHWAEKQDASALKNLFTQFAEEERGHKKKLENARRGDLSLFPSTEVQTLNISDFTVEVEPGENMSYQEILVLAMQKEKKSFVLYNRLAGLSPEPAFRNLFIELAREEANHKLRFEIEYDNEILTEN